MFKKNLKLLQELVKCMFMAKLYLQILVIEARSHRHKEKKETYLVHFSQIHNHKIMQHARSSWESHFI